MCGPSSPRRAAATEPRSRRWRRSAGPATAVRSQPPAATTPSPPVCEAPVSVTVGAVDFGASSIRVCRVSLGDGPPELEVVHRYAHAPVHDGAHLRWDWARLVAETERGLELASARGPLASIGIDTWGVDYGLLDGRGELVEPPISYRDPRTAGSQTTLDRIGADRFFATTGLQAARYDTIFQLAAHDRDQLARARHLLLLPELLVHHLTGVVTGEPSSAGTTGLLDLRARTWSTELADAVGIDP